MSTFDYSAREDEGKNPVVITIVVEATSDRCEEGERGVGGPEVYVWEITV